MLTFGVVKLQFAKSLICMKGSDNLLRYLAIVALTNISFLLFGSIFIETPLVILLLALPATILLVLTTLRRLNDSQSTLKWPLLNSLLFFLAALTITIFQAPMLFWLLLPNIVLSLAIAPLKSSGSKTYIYGYNGPVEITASEHVTVNRGTRIEPTLVANTSVSLGEEPQNSTDFSAPSDDFQQHQNGDPQEKNSAFNQTLTSTSPLIEAFDQYKFHLGAAIIIFVVLLFTVKTIFNTESNDEAITADKEVEAEVVDERLHELAMPDDFLLSLSVHDGLFIEWQIGTSDPVSLWSIKSAEGDESCKAITFNNGDTRRTRSVAVESDTLQYAHFSPLDTEFIVRSLAKRGSFTLCGYKFSLKGSQATIGKHAKYSDFMVYSG